MKNVKRNEILSSEQLEDEDDDFDAGNLNHRFNLQSFAADTNAAVEAGSGSDAANLRPNYLDDFVGQSQLKSNLRIFIEAAKHRDSAVDHILFYGPPGLGKTTLSKIIAKEMGVNIRTTSGPMISKVGDLAAILTNLERNDVLFIDEIHRLTPSVEEVLYPAMEDQSLDIIIGEGPTARTVKIDLPNFTLVGATTRLGLISNPLKDRFGIPIKLNFYNHEELQQVVLRGSKALNFTIQPEAALALAKAARGTPRIACRLLRRVRDFMDYKKLAEVDSKLVEETLDALNIDAMGLDQMDHNYLNFLGINHGGGPVGLDTIAAALSEQRDTIEEVIEPYLIKIGFINKTPKGRVLTPECIGYMKFNLQ